MITHGTDTLEETAFLLDLFVDSERRVVFAAAQRVPTEPDSDGPRNLLNAVRIAASPDARGMCVLVTLNSEIHAAADVRKTHAIALDTFKSPGVGPVGYVDGSHVVISRKPARCHRRFRVAEGLVGTCPEFPAAGAGVRRLA